MTQINSLDTCIKQNSEITCLIDEYRNAKNYFNMVKKSPNAFMEIYGYSKIDFEKAQTALLNEFNNPDLSEHNRERINKAI